MKTMLNKNLFSLPKRIVKYDLLAKAKIIIIYQDIFSPEVTYHIICLILAVLLCFTPVFLHFKASYLACAIRIRRYSIL